MDAVERDIGMVGWLGFQLYRVALADGLRERGFTDLREVDGTCSAICITRGARP